MVGFKVKFYWYQIGRGDFPMLNKADYIIVPNNK